MFQNVIMPEVSLSEMRGVMALLALIGNPQSQASAEFLKKLSAEKDEAVAAAAKAASDRKNVQALYEKANELKSSTQVELEAALAKAKAQQEENDSRTVTLSDRDKALRESQAAHLQDVAFHKQKTAAADLAIQTRENAVTAREQKLDRDIQELEARHIEFDRHMAPVIAAAKLAK